jgi:hypothetical protein
MAQWRTVSPSLPLQWPSSAEWESWMAASSTKKAVFLPWRTAVKSGVSPRLLRAVVTIAGTSPAILWQTLSLPRAAARWSGVSPLLFCAPKIFFHSSVRKVLIVTQNNKIAIYLNHIILSWVNILKGFVYNETLKEPTVSICILRKGSFSNNIIII